MKAKHTIWLLLLGFFCFFSGINKTSAQEVKDLPPIVESDLTLEPGNYVIKRNILVKSGATLTINKGSNLLLGPDVSIIVAGNVNLKGDNKEFVNVISLEDNNPGNGFIIKDFDKGKSSFNYVKFKHLKKPMQVQRNWFRDEISVTNCQFKNLTHHDVSLEIQDIDQILADKTCTFTLNQNTFSNNSGGILIANIANDYFKFVITNNVITRNEYTGRGSNGIFSSPLFINYNTAPKKNQPVITGNSICFNFSSLVLRDTVEFYPVNITPIGSAESMDLSANYFGEKKADDLARDFDQISATQRAPFVYFSNLLASPGPNLNGHIYQINVNNLPLGDKEPDKQWNDGIKDITLIANKPVTPGNQFYIAYHFFDKDTLYTKFLQHQLTIKPDGLASNIEILDKVQRKMPNGYFEIDGLYDENLFEIPAITIGKKAFLNRNRDLFLVYSDLDEIPRIITTIDYNKLDSSLINKINNANNLIDTNFFKFKPYKEIEIFSGSSIYFGDLALSGVKFYPANARPAIGLRAGWHFKERLKWEVRGNYVVLVGDDNPASVVGKARGTGYARNLNVRTTVADFSTLLEWDLFKIAGPKYFIPSIFAGAQAYYFKPMGRLDGVYYDLRSIGTEGQTIAGKSEAYSKWSFGIPMGIKIRKEINAKTSVAFSYTYVKLFTDYLDDLSTGYYPDPEALKKVNPNLGEKAVQLSNPGNQTGRRSISADYDGYAYYGLSVIFNILDK